MTPSELKTLALIKDYLESRGQMCFTYNGLRAHHARRRFYTDLDWHTVERNIRKMAEERRGILRRYEKTIVRNGRKRRLAIFCWTDRAEQIYRRVVRNYYIPEDRAK